MVQAAFMQKFQGIILLSSHLLVVKRYANG